MSTYKEHFGLRHAPLDKNQSGPLWDDGLLQQRQERFKWLLDSPPVYMCDRGLITGESGVGKTAVLRQLTQGLNPHQYQLIYLPETDFGRVDIYRNLKIIGAVALGLEPAYRRSQLWDDIKAHIQQQVEAKPELKAGTKGGNCRYGSLMKRKICHWSSSVTFRRSSTSPLIPPI